MLFTGTLLDHEAELRKALVARHQQMFSPPVPDVEVYTSEQLTASHSRDQCQPEINHGMLVEDITFTNTLSLSSRTILH